MTRVNKFFKSFFIVGVALLVVALFGGVSGRVASKVFADEKVSVEKIEVIEDTTYNTERQEPTIIVKAGENVVSSENVSISVKYKKIGAEDSEFSEIEIENAYINAGVYEITATISEDNSQYMAGSVSTRYTINKANVTSEQLRYNITSLQKNSTDVKFTNELVNTLNLPIVYTVTTGKGISINSEGEVTLARNNEPRTQVSIFAKFEGNDNYNPKEDVSYALEVTNKVKITFNNGDQISSFDHTYGDTIQFPTPSKVSTAEFDYGFDKWTPEVTTGESAVEDKTFIAMFTAIRRKYEIKFLWEDGSPMKSYILEYGTMPTCDDPTKSGNAECRYEFTGWTPTVVAVKGNASYTANFVKRLLHVKSEVSNGGESVVEIISTNGIYDRARFMAENASEISFATPKNCENIASYSAKLVVSVEGGSLVPMYLGEKVVVRVKLAEVPSKTKDIKVAMENSEGEIELIDCVIDGEYLTFETNKISDFMIVKDCGNLLATCLISFAFILVVVMVLTVVLVPVLKKQDHTYVEDDENKN